MFVCWWMFGYFSCLFWGCATLVICLTWFCKFCFEFGLYLYNFAIILLCGCCFGGCVGFWLLCYLRGFGLGMCIDVVVLL